MKEHELVTGEDLHGSDNRVLVSRPYKVRKQQENEYAEYNLFDSSDMEEITKARRVVMRPRTHKLELSSTIKLVLW